MLAEIQDIKKHISLGKYTLMSVLTKGNVFLCADVIMKKI